jgi:hypothetical protein
MKSARTRAARGEPSGQGASQARDEDRREEQRDDHHDHAEGPRQRDCFDEAAHRL